jgi:outer membrane protein TolC
VQSEQRKFQLGVSTLFDVIQAADGLTSAMLTDITSRRSHAVAIATLRFETATLLEPGPSPGLAAAALMTPP